MSSDAELLSCNMERTGSDSSSDVDLLDELGKERGGSGGGGGDDGRLRGPVAPTPRGTNAASRGGGCKPRHQHGAPPPAEGGGRHHVPHGGIALAGGGDEGAQSLDPGAGGTPTAIACRAPLALNEGTDCSVPASAATSVAQLRAVTQPLSAVSEDSVMRLRQWRYTTCLPDSGTATPSGSVDITSPTSPGCRAACLFEQGDSAPLLSAGAAVSVSSPPPGLLPPSPPSEATTPSSRSETARAPPTCDADGFFNTGLLEGSQDDEDEREEQQQGEEVPGGLRWRDHRKGGAADHRADWSSTPTHPPPNPHLGAARSMDGAGRDGAAAAVGTIETAGRPATPSSATTTSRRRAAEEQLECINAALPPMNTVRWLSLIITLLVLVNLLCLDLMALGWIRVRVDAHYEAAAPVVASLTTTKVLAGVDASTRATTTTTPSLQRVPLPSLRFTDSSPSAFAAAAAAPSLHTVPVLCSVILWLLVPNGLLYRLLYRGAAGTTVTRPSPRDHRCSSGGVAADSRPALAECCSLYQRLRRQVPQLELVELCFRYGMLWMMLHAAVVRTSTERWLPLPPPPSAPSAEDGGVRRCVPAVAAAELT